jgi:hypothetical protein
VLRVPMEGVGGAADLAARQAVMDRCRRWHAGGQIHGPGSTGHSRARTGSPPVSPGPDRGSGGEHAVTAKMCFCSVTGGGRAEADHYGPPHMPNLDFHALGLVDGLLGVGDRR